GRRPELTSNVLSTHLDWYSVHGHADHPTYGADACLGRCSRLVDAVDGRASAQRPKSPPSSRSGYTREARQIWEDTPMRVPDHDQSPGPDTRSRGPRGRLLTRVLVAVAAAALLRVVGTAGLFLERQRAYDRNIRRIPGAFPAESARPARAPGRAQ